MYKHISAYMQFLSCLGYCICNCFNLNANYRIYSHVMQEEHLMNLQLLWILHLFPLASVDLFVTDTVWYTRHHYAFMSKLKVMKLI
jgi:hypothetical protein